MRRRQKAFRIWANALGPKADECHKVADCVAWVRTWILMAYLITNCFIVAGVIRHWNDAACVRELSGVRVREAK